jgi:hypothetical protein
MTFFPASNVFKNGDSFSFASGLSGVAIAIIGDSTVTHLKSLTLTDLTSSIDPKLARRQRLIERLLEQIQLAKGPTFAPMFRQWRKADDGTRQPTDTYRVIKPWWRLDPTGSIILTLKSGLRMVEIERGKPAIVVGPQERLEPVLNTLIAAAKAGELDKALEPPQPAVDRPRQPTKR